MPAAIYGRLTLSALSPSPGRHQAAPISSENATINQGVIALCDMGATSLTTLHGRLSLISYVLPQRQAADDWADIAAHGPPPGTPACPRAQRVRGQLGEALWDRRRTTPRSPLRRSSRQMDAKWPERHPTGGSGRSPRVRLLRGDAHSRSSLPYRGPC